MMDVNHYIPFPKFTNDWCNVILVFQALGKQPGTHRPELHYREINSQTIFDVKNKLHQT